MTNTGDLSVAIIATIKAEAAARDIHKRALAERSSIPERSMTRYLSGERELSVGALIKIADALGIELASLIQKARERQQEI